MSDPSLPYRSRQEPPAHHAQRNDSGGQGEDDNMTAEAAMQIDTRLASGHATSSNDPTPAPRASLPTERNDASRPGSHEMDEDDESIRFPELAGVLAERKRDESMMDQIQSEPQAEMKVDSGKETEKLPQKDQIYRDWDKNVMASPIKTQGLCLLSLEGGGVRGLSTLFVLKHLMERLNAKRQEGGLPSVKPCEVFDIIGGIDTGGLMAILLARLELSVDDCIAAYCEIAEAALGKDSMTVFTSPSGESIVKFSQARLRQAVINMLPRYGASGYCLLDNGEERKCRAFVCAFDADIKEPLPYEPRVETSRIRSYFVYKTGDPERYNISATICDAVAATFAATKLFDPVTFYSRRFDGGELKNNKRNNSVEQMEEEPYVIWDCDTETAECDERLLKCFISIGPGKPNGKVFCNESLGRTVEKTSYEAEKMDGLFNPGLSRRIYLRKHGFIDPYQKPKLKYRFDVQDELQDIGLDEPAKRAEIEALTEQYLSETERKSWMESCIENLALKQNHAELDLDALLDVWAEGRRDINVLKSMGNLVERYGSHDRWNEAERLAIHVLEIWKTLCMEDDEHYADEPFVPDEHHDSVDPHKAILGSMSSLANVYQEQERWGKAEKLCLQVLDDSKARCGSDHRWTLTCMSDLAGVYAKLQRWDEAEKLYVQALEGFKTKGGAQDDLERVKLNLASVYMSQVGGTKLKNSAHQCLR